MCSLDCRFGVRNRLQAFATVCKRPSWQKVAVPMGKVAKGVIFGCFKCCVASFRVAGPWWQKVAVPMGKVAQGVIVWKCQVRRSFVLRGRRSTLWHVDL